MTPHMDWEQFFSDSLIELDRANQRRERQVTLAATQSLIFRNGQASVNFGGNDYLGLRNHPQILAAAIAAIQTGGVGSGASPAVTGYSLAQQQLESELAHFSHMPAAVVVFSSGYSGNLATLSSLAARKTTPSSAKLAQPRQSHRRLSPQQSSTDCLSARRSPVLGAASYRGPRALQACFNCYRVDFRAWMETRLLWSSWHA